MGLKNAFEDIMTERTARLILAASNYARDINDRMRVIVDNTVPITISGGPYMQGSATVNTYKLWYDPSSVYSVDNRDSMRQESLQHGKISRQRWTFN